MTYNTLYQRHVTRVVYVIGQIYTSTTHASADFFALQSNVTSVTPNHITISPAYRSAVQRRFPPVWKCNGLAVSKHVLYVIALCMRTWREVRNFAWHRSGYVITHQFISTLTDIFSLHWTLLFTTMILPDLFVHDSSAGWARWLFKPSKRCGKSSSFDLKKLESFGYGFLCRWHHNRGRPRFRFFWPTSSGPELQLQEGALRLFNGETRQKSASLKPLISLWFASYDLTTTKNTR